MIPNELFDDFALISGQWLMLCRNRLILLPASCYHLILKGLEPNPRGRRKARLRWAAGPFVFYFHCSGLRGNSRPTIYAILRAAHLPPLTQPDLATHNDGWKLRGIRERDKAARWPGPSRSSVGIE